MSLLKYFVNHTTKLSFVANEMRRRCLIIIFCLSKVSKFYFLNVTALKLLLIDGAKCRNYFFYNLTTK